MNDNIKLSVVIPSYNELRNLERGVLEGVLAHLEKQPYQFEIILTDDGSTDGTLERLNEFAKKSKQIRVLANHHAGKAPTVSAGMLAARGKYCLFTDFDQSTPIAEVDRALAAISQADIVIGSRETKGARRDKEPLHRHIMGRGFNALVQILALRGIQDSQCGFKLFRSEVAQRLFGSLVVYGGNQPRLDAFTGAFDVELLFLARKLGLRVIELPVEWAHHESDRVSPIKDSLRMLRDILRIRVAWASGKYRLSLT